MTFSVYTFVRRTYVVGDIDSKDGKIKRRSGPIGKIDTYESKIDTPISEIDTRSGPIGRIDTYVSKIDSPIDKINMRSVQSAKLTRT